MATERRYGGEEYYPAFTGLFGRGIGNDAKVLYGFLVYRSDGNQEWTDSIRGVARAIDVSFKMAVKAIGQLKAAKLIDCESISGGTHGGSTKFIILAGNTGPLPGLFTDEPRRKRAAVGSARASLRQRAALPTAARVDPVGSAIGGGVDPAGSAVYPVGSARAYISDSPHTESMKNKSSSSSSSSTAHVGAHTAGDDEEDEISKVLFDRGFRGKKLTAIRERFLNDRIEHAMAIADDLEFTRKLKGTWGGAFLKALKAGPDGWPLPPGVMTRSQHADRAAKAEQRKTEQQRARDREAAFEATVTAWAESVGPHYLRREWDALPERQRRMLGLPWSPASQAYLYKRQHSHGNQVGRAEARA